VRDPISLEVHHQELAGMKPDGFIVNATKHEVAGTGRHIPERPKLQVNLVSGHVTLEFDRIGQ
jgi:hypothetical protein